MGRSEPAVSCVSTEPAAQPSLPDTTVVLLVHGPSERETRTAALVRAQAYPGNLQLLVVDSSPDVSGPANRALRDAADVWERIPPASFGHGRTRNVALDMCTTPVVAFLSQDANPADDRWLVNLVTPLAAGLAEASYGRQRVPDRNPEREATFGYLYPTSFEVKTKARVPELGIRTYHFSDVTSAFLADVARATRFPEDIPTFEDVGIAKRLLDAGHRVAYVPDAVVLHAHALGWRSMIARYRQIGAVYERLGIFADLRQATGRTLLSEGVRVSRAIAPSAEGRRTIQRAAVAGVKAGAVAWGRIDERRRARRARPHASPERVVLP